MCKLYNSTFVQARALERSVEPFEDGESLFVVGSMRKGRLVHGRRVTVFEFEKRIRLSRRLPRLQPDERVCGNAPSGRTVRRDSDETSLQHIGKNLQPYRGTCTASGHNHVNVRINPPLELLPERPIIVRDAFEYRTGKIPAPSARTKPDPCSSRGAVREGRSFTGLV